MDFIKLKVLFITVIMHYYFIVMKIPRDNLKNTLKHKHIVAIVCSCLHVSYYYSATAIA